MGFSEMLPISKYIVTFCRHIPSCRPLCYLHNRFMLCFIRPTSQNGHACLQAGLSLRHMAASMPWRVSWPSLMP